MSISQIRIMQISSEYTPYIVSGLGTHVRYLAQGLSEIAQEVLVLAYNPSKSCIESDGKAIIRYVSTPDKLEDIRNDLNINRIADLNERVVRYSVEMYSQRAAPNLIHCHDWYAYLAAKTLRQYFAAPIVSTVHFLEESSAKYIGRNSKRAFIETAQKDMLNISDAIISVSQFIKDELVKMNKVDPAAVHVVHNGVDVADITAAGNNVNDVENLRVKYAPNGEKIILFVGRIDYLKGVTDLLVSASLVLENVNNVVYLLAGEYTTGEYTDVVFSLIQNLPKLANRVRLLGKLPRDQVFKLYHAASIVAIPSKYEAFPYVAVEAMTAGAPVIASNVGGLPELIENRKNGILIPLNRDNYGAYNLDILKLAGAQIELLRDDGLRAQLGISAQRLAMSRYTLENMVNATAELYKDTIKRHSNRRSADLAALELDS